MSFIRKTTDLIIIVLFSVLVAVVFYQVVARYIFNDPPPWTEELARYCQVWIILLTSSVCIRKGSHLAVDYFSHRLSPGLKRIIRVLSSVLIALYTLVVTIFGWKLVVVGQYQVSPALQIKMSYIYLIFPLSGILMLSEALIKTRSFLREKSRNPRES